MKLIECVNPVKGKWRIRWDVQPEEDGTATYMEEEFGHKPTAEEIRQTIVGWYSRQTAAAILSGFEYEGSMVWLSLENQLNYRAAQAVAVQTGGETLPVTFKLGTDDEPVYKVFDSLDKLNDFCNQYVRYIQDVQATGWKKREALDLSLYET